jgi:protein O-GlcNAc transferase
VLRTALNRWPQSASLLTALGQVLRESGQLQPALGALREALGLDATPPEAHYALGFCLVAAGQRADARVAVKQALQIRPDYPEALQLLASLAVEEGDVAAAEAPIARLMVLRPDDDNSRVLFAVLHLIKGLMARDAADLALAEKIFRSGLEVMPEFPDLWRERGLVLRQLGRSEEARQSFEQGARDALAAGNTAQAAEFRDLLRREPN